jgi:hypothetical protein
MKFKALLTCGLVLAISGCAAGMIGVHQGNIDTYKILLAKLGPQDQDTADEAKEREMWARKLKISLDSLSEYKPKDAEEQRKRLEYTFDVQL